MRVLIREMDNGLTSTLKGAEKLKALIEPALARGEIVELDFEGVGIPYGVFLSFSIGTIIEQDKDNHVHTLLRYTNLKEPGSAAIEGAIELAIRRRENPRWAAALGRAAEEFARRD